MVAKGMRRYKVRQAAHEALIGQGGPAAQDRLDLDALFGRQAPRRLEIGFGHGEFMCAMAAAHPAEDFVGVEYDALRVTKTAHKCLKDGIANVRLFEAEAHAFVRFRLPAAAFHRIYILFSDPWPKAGQRRRRLVNRSFLVDLTRVAAPGCRLIFASDTINYAFQTLSNLSLLPGCWTSLHPAGYRIDAPVRFETVFERYKRAEGCRICQLMLERTFAAAPEPCPWWKRQSSEHRLADVEAGVQDDP